MSRRQSSYQPQQLLNSNLCILLLLIAKFSELSRFHLSVVLLGLDCTYIHGMVGLFLVRALPLPGSLFTACRSHVDFFSFFFSTQLYPLVLE